MDKRIACLILATGKNYQKLGKVAADSFSKWHPDVDLYFINDENEKEFFSYKNKNSFSVGIYKYVLAAEIMKLKKYNKIIILGSDTITCSRLDEFLDNDEDDFLATLDYPYQFVSRHPPVCSPDSETHLNADVICFNNIRPIYDIIKASHFHKTYYEQGGLNEIAWSGRYKYNFSIVDGPYKTSKIVYNVRSKGNMCLPLEYQDHSLTTGVLPKYPPHEKPWGEPLNKFYVEGEKLFTGDGKQIKVWHYCDGLGANGTTTFEKIVNNYIFKWFSENTKKFFKDYCNAGDFFEKEFVIQ